jgi:restriction endonuclease S subunit
MTENYMSRITDILPPYPAYKDSGVPWLGQVPEHWEVRRLKRIARLNPSKSEVPLALRDGQAVFLPMERVGSDGPFDASETRPISDLWNGFTYFRRGDVIVAKITPCFENGKGACLENLPTAIGFGSTEFHVIRPSSAVTAPYVYRVTTLSEFRRLGADEMTGAGGQQRVPAEFIANLLMPFPPLPEQTAIVRFLDYMDRRIRRYIRAKQKLIKLLEEYRQVLIHRAVTGQVDVRTGQPYPAYKPSGLPWLGPIPKHWEVKRMKFAAMINPSKSESCKVLQKNPIVTFLPMECVGTDGQFECREKVEAAAISNGFTYFRRGDILLAKITPCFENGKGAHLEDLPTEIGFGSTEFHVLRARAGLIPRFLFYQTRDYIFRDLGARTMTGSAGQQRVPVSFVADYPCLLPPPAEQLRIARAVAAVTQHLTTALTRLEREIELLRELRTRLVADVVTGKLDVRALAERLPAEPPPAEAPPEAEAPAEEEGLSDRSDWSEENEPATLPP